MLEVYQKAFLQMALEVNALKFGSFTLKSGRESPYFFNAGAFCDGKSLYAVADAYAETICKLQAQGVQVDVLYGPAYKGIPLVATVALLLYMKHGISLPWAFNRKEAKNHGEGGIFVGEPLQGKNVLLIDDVLTAGTAIRESITLLKAEKANPVAVVVALDRQEGAGEEKRSALHLLAENENLIAKAVVTLDDLLQFVASDAALQPYFPAMKAYRQQYGV